ncbi:protein kinase [Xylariaceae sp. FL0255]|nr:protein kinase [Xylariaceae sp. FL0255]
MWWNDSQIKATVTRQFVCSHLTPDEIELLDTPLGFGDGLTDDWEWIDEKAKRIFLILVDIGLPDQIFGIIDDSWDDNDLPIALDQVDRLALTSQRDDRIVKKFYARQFFYLVQYLEKGAYFEYQPQAVIPVVLADKRPGLSTGNNAVERVELPNNPGQIFTRRRFSLGASSGPLAKEIFLNEVRSTKNLQHEHIASYYASYTHQEYAYAIFSHTSDSSVKSLLAASPGPLKALAKQDRRLLVMNWVHCLTDTLCYIHKRARSHGNIKPSTILFSSNNHIFYASMSRLGCDGSSTSGEGGSGGGFDRESYDYAAPEQWYRPTAAHSLRRNIGAGASSSPSTMSSSDSTTFFINRGAEHNVNNPAQALLAPNPHLDPQAADVFSLGCVILELLGLTLKRTTRNFASHRAAKHKSAGRGGAVPDSSFHKNLGQVESWMAGLAKDAAKKDDPIFLGVTPMLHVVARMLSVLPAERPTALEVEQAMYKILTERCGIAEPHCVHEYGGRGRGDLGLGNLSLDETHAHSERFSISTRKQNSMIIGDGPSPPPPSSSSADEQYTGSLK